MTAKSNIISLRAYAKQKARLIGPAAPQDIRDRQWDTDDLKRLLFSDAGAVEEPIPALLTRVASSRRIVWN
ncbi:MAG: hypothetical protein GXP03_00605 [Alphaproteobacteria bacterium]|nr:hypothetical protein [Alphaproteobacteria bacterium]